MQPDHRANLDVAARTLGESLAIAWAYFHLLRGLDGVRLKHPRVVDRVDLLLDRMWRSAFDEFLANVGILLENKRSNHSRHSVRRNAFEGIACKAESLFAAASRGAAVEPE